MFLIHFKSHDLSLLHRQGRFWHLFLATGAVLISQDEADEWTCHTPVPIDTDVSKLDPLETLRKSISDSFETSLPLSVDKILVSSFWRPGVYLSSQYASPQKRIYLAGDAAHQTIPTGGYGMNTALGDSFDIGWKLAAVLHGTGGPALLESYKAERHPVADNNLKRAAGHWEVHGSWQSMVREAKDVICAHTQRGRDLRETIRQFVETNDSENQDVGTELGYRCRDSPVISRCAEDIEPPFDHRRYVPSTWPGARAPSVRLKTGQNIFELLGTGPEFTIVDFTVDAGFARRFEEEAKSLNIPLKMVHLPEESHVRKIWERDAVLVRPDDFVAWRSKSGVDGRIDGNEARLALMTAVGRR